MIGCRTERVKKTRAKKIPRLMIRAVRQKSLVARLDKSTFWALCPPTATVASLKLVAFNCACKSLVSRLTSRIAAWLLGSTFKTTVISVRCRLALLYVS